MKRHNNEIRALQGVSEYAGGSDTEHLEWRAGRGSVISSNRIFTVTETTYTFGDGRQGDYLNINCADWVNVCALCINSSGENCLLMVRQFRHGSDSVSLEFPGGVVNEGEAPQTAALREFREETGFMAEDSKFLGSCSPNPALMANKLRVYAAWNIAPAGGQNLDTNEVIDVVLVPVRLLREEHITPFHTNGIMLMSWYYFLQWYETLHE